MARMNLNELRSKLGGRLFRNEAAWQNIHAIVNQGVIVRISAGRLHQSAELHLQDLGLDLETLKRDGLNDLVTD